MLFSKIKNIFGCKIFHFFLNLNAQKEELSISPTRVIGLTNAPEKLNSP